MMTQLRKNAAGPTWQCVADRDAAETFAMELTWHPVADRDTAEEVCRGGAAHQGSGGIPGR